MEQNKVILITGTSSGIGLVIANHLHRQGHRVYGTSRTKKDETGYSWFAMDVTSTASVHSVVDQILSKEGQIDFLVNNAGIGMISTFEEAPETNLQMVMDTNFHGIVRTIQAVLPHMRERGQGGIINVSSIAGLMGLPFRSIYCASKFAVEGLTEALRQEILPFGLQACTIQPGSIKTDIKGNRVSHLPVDSPYNPQLQDAVRIIDDEVGRGIEAQAVANLVEKLIRQRPWRAKYVVAKPFQIAVSRLRPFFPASLFERMTMKHYGLDKKIP